MPSARPATPRQTGYLWGFCRKYRQRPTALPPNFWREGPHGVPLSLKDAMKLIGTMKRYEETGTEESKQEVLRAIRPYDPAFVFRDDAGNSDLPTPVPTGQQGPTRPEPPEPTGNIMTDIKNRVPEEMFGSLLEYIEEIKKRPLPSVEVSSTYIKPVIYDEVSAALTVGTNILVHGPAGCGKSRMGAELAKSMGKEFFCFSMSGGARYSQVFGGNQLSVDQGKQVTKFVEGPLLQALQRNAVVCIDEIFAADPDVLLGLNSILEPGQRSITTPNGVIKVNPECVIMATANTTGRTFDSQYTGAQRVDDSLNDRFAAVYMDYDCNVEKQLVESSVPDTDDRQDILSRLQTLRNRVRSANISFDPSTRRLITMIKLLAAGLDKEKSFNMAFLSHLSTAEQAKVGSI